MSAHNTAIQAGDLADAKAIAAQLLAALQSCPIQGGPRFYEWFENVRQPLLNELA